jgi:hypothetical protein
MAIPGSDIKLANDIYGEANGGYPGSGEVSLNDISFFSYFAGPNGSNSISYNAYGRGESSGDNRIYDTSVVSPHTNVGVADFANVVYFYDNSTYQITLVITNNLPLPSTPPDPPDLNDVNVNIALYDRGSSYQYAGGGGLANASSVYGPNAISVSDDPIISEGYWYVTIQGQNPMFPGCNADLSINGNLKFSAEPVSGGPGGTTFDFSTFGQESVSGYISATGLYFEVTLS